MKCRHGIGAVLTTLTLSAAPLAFGVDPFYDSSPETLPGAVTGEEAFATIEESENGLSTPPSASEQDMHDAGSDNEPGQAIQEGEMEREG